MELRSNYITIPGAFFYLIAALGVQNILANLFWITPDLLLAFVIFISVVLNPSIALVVTFIVGLVFDLWLASSPGYHCLYLLILIAVSIRLGLRRRLQGKPRWSLVLWLSIIVLAASVLKGILVLFINIVLDIKLPSIQYAGSLTLMEVVITFVAALPACAALTIIFIPRRIYA